MLSVSKAKSKKKARELDIQEFLINPGSRADSRAGAGKRLAIQEVDSGPDAFSLTDRDAGWLLTGHNEG